MAKNRVLYSPTRNPRPRRRPILKEVPVLGYLVLIEKWAENLEEVTLNRWLKPEGVFVREGDLLCEIITDKVTFEYEVEVPGYVRRRFCPEKSVLPVGYAIAFIGDEEERVPDGVESRNSQLLQQHAARASLDIELDLFGDAALGAPRPHRDKLERRVRATPAARRVARENDVTIEQVAAWAETDGPISQADVEAYLEAMDEDE